MEASAGSLHRRGCVMSIRVSKGMVFLLLLAVFGFGLVACDAVGGIGGSDAPYKIGVMSRLRGRAKLTAMLPCKPSRWPWTR